MDGLSDKQESLRARIERGRSKKRAQLESVEVNEDEEGIEVNESFVEADLSETPHPALCAYAAAYCYAKDQGVMNPEDDPEDPNFIDPLLRDVDDDVCAECLTGQDLSQDLVLMQCHTDRLGFHSCGKWAVR